MTDTPGSVQFLVDGFGERLDEGLGGRINGHVGNRLEPRDRRDVEHRSGAPFDHAGQCGMGEFHQRQRVEDDLFTFAFDRQSLEYPAGAEAGAVAQTGDRFGAKPFRQFAARSGVGQVERHELDPDRYCCAGSSAISSRRSRRRATSTSG